MTRPKNRNERRRRNALAQELSDRKYRQRVVEPYRREKRKWDEYEEEDVLGFEHGPRPNGLNSLSDLDEHD